LSASLKRSVGRHWKVLGLTAVILVTLASSAYAYWRINAPSSASLYVTATSPPLELRMELEKTELQLNETIIVRLFLTNIGSEKITIVFNYMNDMVGFIVEDENDTEVFVHPEMFLTAVRKVDLEPGDQISEMLKWSQKGNRPGNYGLSVSAGTYKIIGRTGKFGIVGKNLPKGYRIETPLITITTS